jgi:hypothetical protein
MPEEYGGSGGTYAHESAILEAISHVGVDGFGIALHNSIVAPYIQHYGSEEQKAAWLPKMATGELIGAIAMTEPGAGSDLQGVKTSAKKDGNHYVINGSKTFITNGQLANLIIVVTKTDPGRRREGHVADRHRDRRSGGFRARPQSRQDRSEDRTTRRNCSSTTCACRHRTCSARGRLGLRPADAAAAAGKVADRRQRDRDDRAGAGRDHRLRQGAQGLRQGGDRVPEHAVQAGGTENRGHRRAHLLQFTASASIWKAG